MQQTEKKRPPRIETQDDLFQDIAGTYALEGARTPADEAALKADLEALNRDGYVILERIISDEENARAKVALEEIVGPMGRNDFEGLKTQRAYSLLRKTRALDGLVAHPRVLAILEAMMGPGSLLSACLAVRIHPGEKRQPPHFDAAFYPSPRPRLCHAVSAIWALDPFTEENGGTIVWPESHLWPEGKKPTEDDPHFSATMPAGSAIIFHGDLWHAGGANRASAPRMGFTPQYCGQWLRTMENMSLAIPPARLPTSGPRSAVSRRPRIRPRATAATADHPPDYNPRHVKPIHHHADLLRQRQTAHRTRLHDDRLRCLGAIHALRG